MCESLLATGQLAEAEAHAAALCTALPTHQYALALRATAWRLMGDARYLSMYDYQSMVAQQELETPAGFVSLNAFLCELSGELQGMHSFLTHPLFQSVRGGSQLTLQSAELSRPLIAMLFAAIEIAVQCYLDTLGPGNDPLRVRNAGRAALTGAWSVRLRSGGHHADHVHPQGWLSSACYIGLPQTIGDGPNGRAGWLRFGRPGVKTLPPLDADHSSNRHRGYSSCFRLTCGTAWNRLKATRRASRWHSMRCPDSRLRFEPRVHRDLGLDQL